MLHFLLFATLSKASMDFFLSKCYSKKKIHLYPEEKYQPKCTHVTQFKLFGGNRPVIVAAAVSFLAPADAVQLHHFTIQGSTYAGQGASRK